MKRFGLGLALVCLALSAVTVSAQERYPTRPVKIIVPYAPGGATDITARLFGEQMRQSLGEQFVVESKPGAFGILAIEEMARSKPDGYTLMVGNVTTNAITPLLFSKKLSINFEKEVVSVSRLAIYPSFLLTTTHDFEPKSVAELVAYAKKNPGKVRYTSAGVGSFPHFDTEVFSRRAGIEMLHIPNKAGAAGMINDLVVGDAQVAFINAASTASMIKAGKLRPIAVLAETRLADYPDVPTLAEALAHLLAEQACGNVGRAAGGIGHDDLHWPRGIFFLRREGSGTQCEANERQTQTEAFHRILPVNWRTW